MRADGADGVPSTKGRIGESAVKPAIAVLDYDSGNLRSVATAVRAVGGEPVVTPDPVEALRCSALIVPGVGAFGSCVRSLRARGLDGAIVRAAISGRPVLGVCVGMQILFERSEESPDVAGPRAVPGLRPPASRPA